MENPHLRKASHIGLWIGMIAVGSWLVWSATHTKNVKKTDNFATGSHQTNTYKITKNYGLAFMDLALMPFTIHGCTRADKLEGEPQQITNEVNDAKQLINATVDKINN